MKISNFVVKTTVDKKSDFERPMRSFDRYVQGGAALTEEKICELQDDAGENISRKNRQYCELTVLYWMWQNVQADVYGLEHYRRWFGLTEDEIRDAFEVKGADAIVSKEMELPESVAAFYLDVHCNDVWNAMMEILKEDEKTYPFAREIFEERNKLRPFNMGFFSARFLDDYCNWLFPILERVEAQCGRKWDVYQNRYPGFLAERLFTLFCTMHARDYRIMDAVPIAFQDNLAEPETSEDAAVKKIVNMVCEHKAHAAWGKAGGYLHFAGIHTGMPEREGHRGACGTLCEFELLKWKKKCKEPTPKRCRFYFVF